MQRLGLLTKTPEQLQVLSHVLQELQNLKEQQLAGKPAVDPVLGAPDPALTARLADVDVGRVLVAPTHAWKLHRRKHHGNGGKMDSSSHASSDQDGGGLLGMRAGRRGSTISEAAAAAAAAERVLLDDMVVGAEDKIVVEYRKRLLFMNKAWYGKLGEQGVGRQQLRQWGCLAGVVGW
jgi:hypothetical protein